MSAIVPAIVPTTHAELTDKLGRLDKLVTSVQIDIADGKFAGPATWPYAEQEPSPVGEDRIPYLGHFDLEIDLMANDPSQVAGEWIEDGATRLTLHVESATDLPKLLANLARRYGHDKGFAPDLLSIGLAINIGTDASLIAPYADQADYLQIMGIKTIGHQGEPFSAEAFQKIRVLRKKYPDIPLQVDGGVTLENAPRLLDAGVTRLIIGSALWKAPDLKEELAKFNQLAEEYGLFRQ